MARGYGYGRYKQNNRYAFRKRYVNGRNKRYGPKGAYGPNLRTGGALFKTSQLKERRYFDSDFVDNSINVLDAQHDDICQQIVKGVEQTQRRSNRNWITHVYWRGQVSAVLGAADAVQSFRLTCFVDTQANGTAPAIANMFKTADGTRVFGFKNTTDGVRYKILKDEPNIVLSATGASGHTIMAPPGMVYTTQPFNWYIKFNKPLLITYKDPSMGGIGDILRNNLCFSIFSRHSENTVLKSTIRMYYEG